MKVGLMKNKMLVGLKGKPKRRRTMAKTLATGRKRAINTKTLITGRKRMGNTKTQKVIEHLKTHRSITTWEAIELYRATRLSAIIFNLRLQGFNIDSDDKVSEHGVKFTRYYLNSYPA